MRIHKKPDNSVNTWTFSAFNTAFESSLYALSMTTNNAEIGLAVVEIFAYTIKVWTLPNLDGISKPFEYAMLESVEYLLMNAVSHSFEQRVLEKFAYTIKVWQGPNLGGISKYLDICQADSKIVCTRR